MGIVGQGDKGTRGQGDKGTRGQGDKGVRNFLLLVYPSSLPILPLLSSVPFARAAARNKALILSENDEST